MELYNEQLFDLLSQKSRREDTIVDIREDGNKGIKIPGLTEVDISTVDETMGLLEKASEGRVTAATAMIQQITRHLHAQHRGQEQVRREGLNGVQVPHGGPRWFREAEEDQGQRRPTEGRNQHQHGST